MPSFHPNKGSAPTLNPQFPSQPPPSTTPRYPALPPRRRAASSSGAPASRAVDVARRQGRRRRQVRHPPPRTAPPPSLPPRTASEARVHSALPSSARGAAAAGALSCPTHGPLSDAAAARKKAEVRRPEPSRRSWPELMAAGTSGALRW